jgi:hypothetical protein
MRFRAETADSAIFADWFAPEVQSGDHVGDQTE